MATAVYAIWAWALLLKKIKLKKTSSAVTTDGH
jgi:hypothetical protein